MSLWSDIGNVVASVASTVGDAVEAAGDAIVDTAESVVDAVTDAVDEACTAIADSTSNALAGTVAGDAVVAVVNLVTGLVAGVANAARDLAHDVADILRDELHIIGSALRLDLRGVLQGLASLAAHALDAIVDVARVSAGGYFAGGVVSAFERDALRRFVRGLLATAFGADATALASALARVGLTGAAKFGLRMSAIHKIFVLDSADVDLAAMHAAGTIDLFALAGLVSFSSFDMLAQPRTVVRRVDASGKDIVFPVNRFQIQQFLDAGGRGQRLRVYALSREAAAEYIRVATRKAAQLGVLLDWNDGGDFSTFRGYSTHRITAAEYALDTSPDTLEEYLVSSGLRTGATDDDCTLLALAAFRYLPSQMSQFGITAGRSIAEGNDATMCATPNRDDMCCVTVDTQPASRDALGRGSGVIYRDVWPAYVFRYVLAHEIGHYLGLCHFGHNGFQNIMWRAGAIDAQGTRLGLFSLGTLNFYLDSEPHFTLQDAMNAWRFIVDQMMECV